MDFEYLNDIDYAQLSPSDIRAISSNPNVPKEYKIDLLASILVQIFLELQRQGIQAKQPQGKHPTEGSQL